MNDMFENQVVMKVFVQVGDAVCDHFGYYIMRNLMIYMGSKPSFVSEREWVCKLRGWVYG
jgi:hypothetical protein